ncbi:hypothetical protein SNE40_005580 [Patella caerulea]|uniref:Ubiquitin-like protein ATG12 n=1 Tax=Patella caerulea TaxID=87958 RepID=A0AAN8PWN4_PATCE
MSDENNSVNNEQTPASEESENVDNVGQDKKVDEAQPHETEEPDSTAKPATSSNNTAPSKTKIDVLLKPAGDAPIMKKKKWAVDRNKPVCWVSEFIKKYLKFTVSDSLFLYVNQSFSPSPDTEVGVLFDSFGSDGKLVLHYCKTQAWG